MNRKAFTSIIIVGVGVIIWGLIVGSRGYAPSKVLQERLISSAAFEVLALNPVIIPDSQPLPTNSDCVLRYPVVGRVSLSDLEKKRELVDLVSSDMAHANHPPYACMLEPRHGIRCGVGSNSMVMLICYHCGDVVLEHDGKSDAYLIKMDGGLRIPASKRMFEKIFKEAGIKTDSN